MNGDHTQELALGESLRDNVTGAIGTATASIKYLHGSDQILLEFASKDGVV